MKLTVEKKLELEKKAAHIACDLATLLEDALQNKLGDDEESGILQALIYSELASWYMCTNLTICRAQKIGARFDVLIQEIVNNAMVMLDNYKIIKERH
jgi:hypothetical protein